MTAASMTVSSRIGAAQDNANAGPGKTRTGAKTAIAKYLFKKISSGQNSSRDVSIYPIRPGQSAAN
jgi:hypothetical protein